MERLNAASIHGRFQPFHNGHLDYLLQALSKSEFVYLGLTQIFRPAGGPESQGHREKPEANPLTYFERAEIISATLLDQGVDERRCSIIPFPIETVSVLPQFIPLEITCLTTRLNQWNDEKIRRLRERGYRVELLNVAEPDGVRITTGSKIRELIRNGDSAWDSFVPSGGARVIREKYLDRFT